MKKNLGCILLVLFILTTPFLLFGYSTETRIGLKWGVIYDETDLYFRIFPMVMMRVEEKEYKIPFIFESNPGVDMGKIDPHWLISKNYRDKSGFRIDTNRARSVLLDKGVNDKLIKNEKLRNELLDNFKKNVPLNTEDFLDFLDSLK